MLAFFPIKSQNSKCCDDFFMLCCLERGKAQFRMCMFYFLCNAVYVLVVRRRRRPHPSAESIAEKIQGVRHSCHYHATIISDEIHLLDRRGSMLKSGNTRPGHRLKRRGKYCMIGLSTMCPKIISYTETCHMVHLSISLSEIKVGFIKNFLMSNHNIISCIYFYL